MENPRLTELREQLKSIDFPEITDEGDFAPFARACREAGKAYHGMIIAEGIPAMIEIARQTIVDQLNER